MSTTPQPLRLVGREQQTQELASAVQRARAGVPQVVVVEGEPGTGKTALVSAVLDTMAPSTAVRRLRCDPAETGIAFAAVELLLGDLRDALSAVEVGRSLLSWYGDLQADGSVGVLVLDDVQWMDAQSVAAFRFALRRLRVDATLTLLVRRPPQGGDPWQGVDAAGEAPAVIRLGPLDASAVRELVRATHGWDLDRAAIEHVVERTGGVPLLVNAVLRDAVAPGDLTSRELPQSATAVTRQMIASLDADARALVEAVAVLASPTGVVAAGRVADIAQPGTALDAAVASGLLTRVANSQLDCAHDLLRDAVLDSIPPTRLRQLHTRAADWVSGDRRLDHRFAATDRPDAHLVAELVSAAERARQAGRLEAAATHLVHACAISDDAAQRANLVLDALVDAIRAPAPDLVRALSDEARALPASAAQDFALGLLALEESDVPLAKRLLARAAGQAGQDGRGDLAARAVLALAELQLSLNEAEDALVTTADTGLAADAELAHDLRTLRAMGYWQRGDLAGALELLDEVSPTVPTARWQPDMLAARGMVRMLTGELDRALADLDASMSSPALWRSSTNQSRALLFRANARYYVGDWDGAAVDTAAARAVAEAQAQAWTAPMAHAMSSHVPANRGQRELAGDYLQRARDGLRAVHSTQVLGVLIAGEVMLATAFEDWASVARTLAPLRNEFAMARLGPTRMLRWMMTGWVLACLRLGEHTQAADGIVEYEAALGTWSGGPISARLEWLKGQLAEARNDPDAAQRHYLAELADPVLAATPFLHAQVLHTAGRLDRATGRRREAIEKLSLAQRIFVGLRAAPYIERCSADLAACGLPAATTGAAANGTDRLTLTEREEDVVALAVRGHTNKEIAAELFVTVKTVEYHLGNVFAKLGVHNRHELRRARTS